jgi:hypothetical protein
MSRMPWVQAPPGAVVARSEGLFAFGSWGREVRCRKYRAVLLEMAEEMAFKGGGHDDDMLAHWLDESPHVQGHSSHQDASPWAGALGDQGPDPMDALEKMWRREEAEATMKTPRSSKKTKKRTPKSKAAKSSGWTKRRREELLAKLRKMPDHPVDRYHWKGGHKTRRKKARRAKKAKKSKCRCRR